MIFTLVLFAITFILQQLLAPKPHIENARPAGLGEFNFPTATQDRVVPLVWGTAKLEGPNVVWYGDLRQVGITKKIKTGMFSSKEQTVGYRYYVGIHFALCMGPVDKLLRIWIADDVVWSTGITGSGTGSFSKPSLFGGDELGNGGVSGTFSFRNGSNPNPTNSYLATFCQQGGDTPRYTGICDLIWQHGYVGNSSQIQPWKFEVQRLPNGLGLTSSRHIINTYDANPACVLYEILTDIDWGLGFPTSDIDVANLQAAGNTLYTEGNGFSFVVDKAMEIKDVISLIERQVDGLVILDKLTGKWKLQLARGGYSIPSLTAITPDNRVEIKNYSRGSWQETTNEVRVNFINRTNAYNGDFAMAQDSANIRTQSGRVIAATSKYSGVMNAATANSIAWRDLRALARPLAKATITVNRDFWKLNPLDVVRWTEPKYGYVDLPMRINKIDLGTLEENTIELSLVEDVFVYDVTAYANPPGTGWTPPTNVVTDITSTNRLIIEAPKKFCEVDTDFPGTYRRVLAAGRYMGDRAVRFHLEVAGLRSGTVTAFVQAGQLVNSITPGTWGGNIDIVPNPDTHDSILAELVAKTDDDVGKYLSNYCIVNNEIFAFKTFSDLGANLRLSGVYRGLCDTAPGIHAVNDKVWLIFIGAGLSDSSFTGASVSVKLLPESDTDTLLSASSTSTVVTLSDKHLRPYPPSEIKVSSTLWNATTTLDTSASASDDGKGFTCTFTRRDYRNGDEVLALKDETSLPTDFPTANNTIYAQEVINDPTGTPVSLYTTSYSNTNSIPVSRSKVLRYTNGAIPSKLRVSIKTRHTVNGANWDALQNTFHDVNVSSPALSGRFNLTALSNGVNSPTWTAPETGTYNFTIGSNVLSTGAVQVKLNAGAFTTVIASGNTTGTLAITSGDSVVVKHTQTGAANETLLVVNPPTATGAYGILIVA